MTDSTVDLSALTKVEDLPEWAQTEIKELRKESQGLRSRLGDAETALSAKESEFEQKATAFQSQIDDLTGKHSAAETALAKTSLAVSKGLPLNVVPMITLALLRMSGRHLLTPWRLWLQVMVGCGSIPPRSIRTRRRILAWRWRKPSSALSSSPTQLDNNYIRNDYACCWRNYVR
ncbi:hypothetical protein GS451_07175 [Rhodococcus hoagii]|nr:hypothetical protein [Prescottella equi]